MPEIKTRERGKDIKTLDKSAIIGQRMKTAYIRSKEQVISKREKEEGNPNGYAEGKIQDAINDGGQLGAYSAKLAFQRGRDVFHRQRAKKAAEDFRQRNKPDNTTSAPELPAAPTVQDLPVERGRELAKQQAVKRLTQNRRIRNREGMTAEESPRTIEVSPPLIRQRDTPAMPLPADKATPAKTFRMVKTPQQTARAAIKTPQTAEIRRQETVQTVRTAQTMTRTARTSAKTAAKKAQRLAKSVAAEVRKTVAAARSSLAALLSGGWVVVLMVVIVVLFGGVLALFGDSAESNAYTPVSAEVDA